MTDTPQTLQTAREHLARLAAAPETLDHDPQAVREALSVTRPALAHVLAPHTALQVPAADSTVPPAFLFQSAAQLLQAFEGVEHLPRWGTPHRDALALGLTRAYLLLQAAAADWAEIGQGTA